ncbi:MAG: glycosyl hydrolase family 5 [Hyphomicrobium denitrificans]|uniref:Cellulase n=1 Tax=Hyphomicrobium denitrificans (strain ATCC 51888 / DSM 1869 / NCIMB 11706 / TK 0415) TaxID=582899 RepID=D8JRH6_HYPDA|nr:hypothetical protein [Hyphomicrobium denitrificans]ADJ22205.1 cellulase [Hyphomicrobium denitrificans ATCC 51888]MBN9290423.1 glycosyl hydrolase family 5 [Hyphomicrobium denitrificans]
MRIATLSAAVVVAAGLSLAAGAPAQAAPVSAPQQTGISQSLVQQAQYWRRPGWRGGRCVKWRNICADRWGWGGPRFRRCMIRNGC